MRGKGKQLAKYTHCALFPFGTCEQIPQKGGQVNMTKACGDMTGMTMKMGKTFANFN